MKVVFVYYEGIECTRLLTNPETGTAMFSQTEEEIVELIKADMVREVNNRGVEETTMHTIRDLEDHGWHIREGFRDVRRLTLYDANPADDPDCCGIAYCIHDLDMYKTPTTMKELVDRVLYAYQHNDNELTGLFFDFDVDMECTDIILAYDEILWTCNGDHLVHIEDGIENNIGTDMLNARFTGHYTGNCMCFLKKVGEEGYLVRKWGDNTLDFIN